LALPQQIGASMDHTEWRLLLNDQGQLQIWKWFASYIVSIWQCPFKPTVATPLLLFL
jgi:hypothetical protein